MWAEGVFVQDLALWDAVGEYQAALADEEGHHEITETRVLDASASAIEDRRPGRARKCLRLDIMCG
jgi:hypothetical protein